MGGVRDAACNLFSGFKGFRQNEHAALCVANGHCNRRICVRQPRMFLECSENERQWGSAVIANFDAVPERGRIQRSDHGEMLACRHRECRTGAPIPLADSGEKTHGHDRGTPRPPHRWRRVSTNAPRKPWSAVFCLDHVCLPWIETTRKQRFPIIDCPLERSVPEIRTN